MADSPSEKQWICLSQQWKGRVSAAPFLRAAGQAIPAISVAIDDQKEAIRWTGIEPRLRDLYLKVRLKAQEESDETGNRMGHNKGSEL